MLIKKIECTLDEWATGRRESIHFKEDQYKGIFKHHLEMLNYLHQETCKLGVLTRMLQQVFDNGR